MPPGLSGNQTPATLVEDEPMDNRAVMVGGQEGILGEWGMEVSSPVYEGKIPAREALEHSKIAATVRFAGSDRLAAGGGYERAHSACRCKKPSCCRRLAVGFEEVSMKQAVRAMSVFPLGGMSGPETAGLSGPGREPGGPRGLSPPAPAAGSQRR